jgi:CRP-like cAMP-binding protein
VDTAGSPNAHFPAHSTFSVIDSRLAARASIMAQSELFAGLSSQELQGVVSVSRLRDYSPDEFLFEQGQPVRTVLLIESGCVKLTQLSSGGNEVILWLHGPGDAAGILNIAAQYGHTCSARAVVKCRVMIWEWPKLDTLPASNQIRRNISRIVSSRIGELEERFREVATERVAKRVASALVRLLNRVGRPSAAGVEIVLSREEIAQLTGTTVFTISRLISKWSEQGLLVPRRESVLIVNPDRLLQIGTEED